MNLKDFFSNPKTTDLPIQGSGKVYQCNPGCYAIEKGKNRILIFSTRMKTAEGNTIFFMIGKGTYHYFTSLEKIDFGFTEEDSIVISFLDLNKEKKQTIEGDEKFLEKLAFG